MLRNAQGTSQNLDWLLIKGRLKWKLDAGKKGK